MNRNIFSTLFFRCRKNIVAFIKMSMHQKKLLAQKFVKDHVVISILIAGTVSIASGSILLPQQGRIICMGSEMRQAFQLLNATESGRKLIKKATLSTRGTPIFLVRGTTVENEMVDPRGETVLGMTRACFRSICSRYTPTGIFVYSNKDLVGSRVDIIALTLAFEFENVIYAMHYPAMEYATDSPEAQRTLEKVALELGLIDKI